MREAKGTELEEEEERTFVPSAVSVPLKPLFRCDRQCSGKTLSYWQLASVVENEGDEAFSTNLCQMCFNKHFAGKRRRTIDKCEVEAGCGNEGVSGKNVENDGKEPYLRGMWEHFSCERSKSKKFRQQEEKQAGMPGQWQQGIASKRVPGTSENAAMIRIATNQR